MKKILCIASLATSLAVTGLAMSVHPAVAETTTIPIIVKDTTSFFWQIVIAGARKAGRELKVEVPALGAQAETDVEGQIAILENAVSKKPAAIVIAPTQAVALGQPITEAARKVKIIGIDSSAESQSFTAFLSTDNVEGGRKAAEALAEAIKANTGKLEGHVALITNTAGAGSLEERAQGFKEALKKYPGLKLTADKVADGQATTGLNITTDLITADAQLVGIFASNLIQAQGASQALAENMNRKIALIGFDSDEKLVQALKDGQISALIVQDPYRMGYDGVKIALAASKEEQVAAKIDTGVTVITKTNLDTAKSQALLLPKLD